MMRASNFVAVLAGVLSLQVAAAQAALIGSSSSNPGLSAKQILDYGASVGSGIYWIDPDGVGGNAAFQAYCDMTTNGGGWTLMAFAGTIPTNKTTTVGSSNYFPVFNNFGTYAPNALVSGTAFSRRDMVDPLFQNSSQILAYRASNLNNQLIFPVADKTSWNNMILPNISYLTMTNNGSTYVTQPASQLAVYNQGPLPRYTGYDWNLYSNADNVGSYATGLNHRSLIYWESLDSAPYPKQWFHAQPLSLVASTGPVNNFQDLAFFLRENVTYELPPVPEPSTCALLSLGLLGMLRRHRRAAAPQA